MIKKRKKYHVNPRKEGGWEVKTEDNSRASNIYNKKDNAINRAKELAKRYPPSPKISVFST